MQEVRAKEWEDGTKAERNKVIQVTNLLGGMRGSTWVFNLGSSHTEN